MLDYISWYLVELKRELRGHPRTHEWLMETRAHLEEHLEDKELMKLDKSEAMKSVITEFGDPAAIAFALRNGPQPSARTKWGYAVPIALLMSTFWIPVYCLMQGWLSSNVNPVVPFLAGPIVGILVLAYACIRTRTWISLPATGALAAVTVAAILISTFTGTPVHVPNQGQTTLVGLAAIPRQIELRENWIGRADEELPRLRDTITQLASTNPTIVEKGLSTLRYENFSAYLSPNRYADYSESLPSDLKIAENWIRLGPTTYAEYGLVPSYPSSHVIKEWGKHGAGYINAIERHQDSLRSEIATLKSAQSTPFFQRLAFVMYGAGATLVMFVPAAIAVNALILGLMGAVRLRRWSRRRQALA